MAKWYRRWTDDPMEFIPSWVRFPVLEIFCKKKKLPAPGFEPGIFGLLARRP